MLGVIENMSYYVCRKCGARHEIFGHGGGARLAREARRCRSWVRLPIVRELREGGDNAQSAGRRQPRRIPSARRSRHRSPDRAIGGLERTAA